MLFPWVHLSFTVFSPVDSGTRALNPPQIMGQEAQFCWHSTRICSSLWGSSFWFEQEVSRVMAGCFSSGSPTLSADADVVTNPSSNTSGYLIVSPFWWFRIFIPPHFHWFPVLFSSMLKLKVKESQTSALLNSDYSMIQHLTRLDRSKFRHHVEQKNVNV